MGALKLLKIIAYSEKDYSCPTGNTFEVMLNPSDYKRSKGIRYKKEEAMNGKNKPTYERYDDDKIEFEFTLDTTGVFVSFASFANGVVPIQEPIMKIINRLEKTVYTYIGTAHEPPYLKVMWGTLSYRGRLLNLDVNYVLFNSEGEPVRAKVKLSFGQYIDQKTQQKEDNTNSPDLTHIIIVKAGDTLPLLCQRVYRSTAYCEDIARVNNLVGFRYIEPGTQLFFPPLTNE